MLEDVLHPALTTLGTGDMCPGGPHLSSPSTNGHSVELAIEPVSLGVDGACANQALMLAFQASTGMVASYRLVDQPAGMRDAARAAVDALQELHVPDHIEVDVTCARYPASSLICEIKRMSGRPKVVGNDNWMQLLSFDRTAAEIGRQVRGVAAYERAAGWAGFDGVDERRFFLECVVDQVLYWYHRRPASTPGFKSPIERLAALNAAAGVVSTRS